jgi:hypothetical protein
MERPKKNRVTRHILAASSPHRHACKRKETDEKNEIGKSKSAATNLLLPIGEARQAVVRSRSVCVRARALMLRCEEHERREIDAWLLLHCPAHQKRRVRNRRPHPRPAGQDIKVFLGVPGEFSIFVGWTVYIQELETLITRRLNKYQFFFWLNLGIWLKAFF